MLGRTSQEMQGEFQELSGAFSTDRSHFGSFQYRQKSSPSDAVSSAFEFRELLGPPRQEEEEPTRQVSAHPGRSKVHFMGL